MQCLLSRLFPTFRVASPLWFNAPSLMEGYECQRMTFSRFFIASFSSNFHKLTCFFQLKWTFQNKPKPLFDNCFTPSLARSQKRPVSAVSASGDWHFKVIYSSFNLNKKASLPFGHLELEWGTLLCWECSERTTMREQFPETEFSRKWYRHSRRAEKVHPDG